MSVEICLPETKKRKIEIEKESKLASVQIVTPGEVISSNINDGGFMRGHGTYLEENKLIASVAGIVERVNKLVSVKPLRTRYNAEIGDLVVCRILEVSQKRWKVDTNSRQDSVLMLSAVNLPGGVQRRKSEADELQMRSFFSEGDVLSAEVQGVFGDGSISIHTRSVRYGKLTNGSFLAVPPALIKRCKTHFHSLPCGVEAIVGLNGYIWVQQQQNIQLNSEQEVQTQEPVSLPVRETISRVCNAIECLSSKFMYISDTSINYVYEASLQYSVKDMLRPDVIDHITAEAKAKIELLEESS